MFEFIQEHFKNVNVIDQTKKITELNRQLLQQQNF